MLLSGEINAIETRSDALGNSFMGAPGVVVVFMLAIMVIVYSNFNSTIPSIIL